MQERIKEVMAAIAETEQYKKSLIELKQKEVSSSDADSIEFKLARRFSTMIKQRLPSLQNYHIEELNTLLAQEDTLKY